MVGGASVVPVSKGQPDVAEPGGSADQSVEVEQPCLKALVAVNRNVNPFALDSDIEQQITLRDVLLTATGANLNILESASFLQAHQWRQDRSRNCRRRLEDTMHSDQAKNPRAIHPRDLRTR